MTPVSSRKWWMHIYRLNVAVAMSLTGKVMQAKPRLSIVDLKIKVLLKMSSWHKDLLHTQKAKWCGNVGNEMRVSMAMTVSWKTRTVSVCSRKRPQEPQVLQRNLCQTGDAQFCNCTMFSGAIVQDSHGTCSPWQAGFTSGWWLAGTQSLTRS